MCPSFESDAARGSGVMSPAAGAFRTSDDDICHCSTLGAMSPDRRPARDSSRSVRSTWLYTLASFVFFVGFYAAFIALLMFDNLAGADEPNTPLVTTVIVLQLVAGAVQVRFCWFLQVGRGGGLPHPAWVTALLASAIAVWTIGLFTPETALLSGAALWTAMCLIASLFPHPWRWTTVLLGALVFAGHMVLASSTGQVAAAPNVAPMIVYGIAMPFMLISGLWWWQIVVELDRHRRSAGQLAVAQERLRFAADLHDIQGHHLQVISLKAELAERLLAADVEAARENIHEVRTIAKQALEETRSLVAGYRQVSLDDELENAREVLTASGARCLLRLGDLPTDAAVRGALASVVREATTNILRHSEASEVTIVVDAGADGWTIEIVNDGVSDEPVATGGSGLAGMRERVSAAGGTLVSGVEQGRFRLRAALPDAAPITVGQTAPGGAA